MSWDVAATQPASVQWVQAGAPVSVETMRAGSAVQTMLTVEGQIVWMGQGPPEIVFGARVADLYMDTVSGVLYRLD